MYILSINIYLFIYLFIYSFIYLLIIYLFITYLLIYLFIYLSIYLFIYLSIYLSIYLFIYLSILCLFFGTTPPPPLPITVAKKGHRDALLKRNDPGGYCYCIGGIPNVYRCN